MDEQKPVVSNASPITEPQKSKNFLESIGKRTLVRGAFFGATGFYLFLEIKRFGGTSLIWGVSGAIAGLVVPILWDAIKKFREEQAKDKEDTDARFDRLEQKILSFMTYEQLDTLRADIGIARADCERALEIAKFSSDTARSNQDRINDIISSGVIFQITQDITMLKIQYAILKRTVEKRNISLNDLDEYE